MKKIIIADDEHKILMSLEYSFRKSGYDVFIARDGTEVLDFLETITPDVILLDIMMPKIDGLSVLRQLPNISDIPVIMLTAKGEEIDRIIGLELGADDYITKPCNPRELLARINAVLKRSAANVIGELHTTHFKLDEQTQSVILNNGDHHYLTGTEFRLLRYFMLHPGHVLSKTVLTEHVYEYDEDKDSNVIEVYVNRLRQKIGAELIQTRRGQGYVFGAEQ